MGLLFGLVMFSPLGPTIARRMSPPSLADLQRARGDSLARTISPDMVTQLTPVDLRSVATADSVLGPATIRAARRELAARERAEQQRIAAEAKSAETWRINSIAQDARAFIFSDGSRCRSASVERATRLVRAHPDWANQDLIRIVCKSVWVGMSADQLRVS